MIKTIILTLESDEGHILGRVEFVSNKFYYYPKHAQLPALEMSEKKFAAFLDKKVGKDNEEY